MAYRGMFGSRPKDSFGIEKSDAWKLQQFGLDPHKKNLEALMVTLEHNRRLAKGLAKQHKLQVEEKGLKGASKSAVLKKAEEFDKISAEIKNYMDVRFSKEKEAEKATQELKISFDPFVKIQKRIEGKDERIKERDTKFIENAVKEYKVSTSKIGSSVEKISEAVKKQVKLTEKDKKELSEWKKEQGKWFKDTQKSFGKSAGKIGEASKSIFGLGVKAFLGEHVGGAVTTILDEFVNIDDILVNTVKGIVGAGVSPISNAFKAGFLPRKETLDSEDEEKDSKEKDSKEKEEKKKEPPSFWNRFFGIDETKKKWQDRVDAVKDTASGLGKAIDIEKSPTVKMFSKFLESEKTETDPETGEKKEIEKKAGVISKAKGFFSEQVGGKAKGFFSEQVGGVKDFLFGTDNENAKAQKENTEVLGGHLENLTDMFGRFFRLSEQGIEKQKGFFSKLFDPIATALGSVWGVKQLKDFIRRPKGSPRRGGALKRAGGLALRAGSFLAKTAFGKLGLSFGAGWFIGKQINKVWGDEISKGLDPVFKSLLALPEDISYGVEMLKDRWVTFTSKFNNRLTKMGKFLGFIDDTPEPKTPEEIDARIERGRQIREARDKQYEQRIQQRIELFEKSESGRRPRRPGDIIRENEKRFKSFLSESERERYMEAGTDTLITDIFPEYETMPMLKENKHLLYDESGNPRTVQQFRRMMRQPNVFSYTPQPLAGNRYSEMHGKEPVKEKQQPQVIQERTPQPQGNVKDIEDAEAYISDTGIIVMNSVNFALS